MKIPLLFKEYTWLIDTISRAGKITFAELNDRWQRREDSDGTSLSRTTFNRHRDAILDMFGVVIDCDRKDGYRYYIYNKHVLTDNSVQNWMLSTLSVSNMLDENMSVQHRILLENIPSGDEKLRLIIKAMRENRRIMLTYRRYGAAAANSFSAAPYCVKLFRCRWYVLVGVNRPSSRGNGKGGNETLAIFSVDRIENVEIQETKFTLNADFDATTYFDECFGIFIGDGSKPERIVLRAYGLEPHYLRDLPLHHSQREIRQTQEYTDFELHMRPTPDFKAHLLSLGDWVQVISPKWLARDIQQMLLDALHRYQNEKT